METGPAITIAGINQSEKARNIQAKVFANLARSCKHPCCQVGLTKPQKPRKRDKPNHQAGKPSQSRLRISFVNETISVVTGKDKETRVKVQPSSSAKAKGILKKRGPKPGQGNQSAKQSGLCSKREAVENEKRRRTQNSEFDDDDLDDLPSLTDVMMTSGPHGQATVSNDMVEDCQNNWKPYPASHSVAKSDDLERSPLFSSRREMSLLLNEFTPEAENSFVSLPPAVRSPPTETAMSASGDNTHLENSEMSSTYEVSAADNAGAWQEGTNSQYLLPPLGREPSLTYLHPLGTLEPPVPSPTRQSLANSSPEWVDMARLLLEELKRDTPRQ